MEDEVLLGLIPTPVKIKIEYLYLNMIKAKTPEEHTVERECLEDYLQALAKA
jgi:hypothetical protein